MRICQFAVALWQHVRALMDHTLNFDILARLNATAVRPHTVSMLFSIRWWRIKSGLWGSYCLGAVVLTWNKSAMHSTRPYKSAPRLVERLAYLERERVLIVVP